jgi:hypothetical protein
MRRMSAPPLQAPTALPVLIDNYPSNEKRMRLLRNGAIGKQLSLLPDAILACIWHFFDLKGIFLIIVISNVDQSRMMDHVIYDVRYV